MLGHIIVISPATPEIRGIARWTLDWIQSEGADVEKTVYTCQSLDLARDSLSVPMHLAQPPSLVVLDHAIGPEECRTFAEVLHECLPESWVVELVGSSSRPSRVEGAFQIPKPVRKGDWEEILQYIYHRANTPAWARNAAS